MDNMAPGLTEKSQNGRGISNGTSFRRSSMHPVSTSNSIDGSISISPTSNFHTIVVVVHKDENGYGMNVSGDNPVYVQSVKEGGAAEKAGLQCGDMIIKVNGINVTQSTHIQVVSLIRASTDVELTVRQNCRNQLPRGSLVSMTSASPRLRPIQSHSSVRPIDKITGPKPVDVDKLRQFESLRVHTLRLMLEKEQLYVDALRSELAKCIDPQSESKIQEELNGATRRVSTLQEQLKNLIANSEHSFTHSQPTSPTNSFQIHTTLEGQSVDEASPPLPTRNRSFNSISSQHITAGAGPPLPPRCNNLQVPSINDAASFSNLNSGKRENDTNDNDTISPHGTSFGHHRTKSNPDPLGLQGQSHNMTPTEACKRLIASESLQDIYKKVKGHPGSCDVDSPHESPSGTPPPPYRGLADDNNGEDEVQIRHGDQTPEASPLRGSLQPTGHQSSTPIGQNIISMEDDDTSDQEFSHLEDHGPFKSLKCLWEHHAHLAVFMNYVLSNSDPSSLLFYLVTDLYKEGNAKEMKKWAYEIHSSFLVPGAPLRLNNVDENFAREIDDVLLKESDKEEILRMIFWKARNRAREELNEQLADFQQKRTAGLGTLFGPSDASLDESIYDKNREMKIIENILVPKIEAFMEDIEKENIDIRRFTTAAALGTIMGKVFGLRGPHANSVLDRCPTFVSKDKSLKAKLLIGKSRKLSVRGHHFVAHNYYTVTYCNHCQLIIWGIGPQGYQCSNCNFNVHRHNCVKAVDENCPGPISKKDKGDNRISKLMDKIRPEREARRKPSSLNFSQVDRTKKHSEERDDVLSFGDSEFSSGDRPIAGLRGVEKRPDIVRESEEKPQNDDDGGVDERLMGDNTYHAAKTKNSTTNINRSESYRERIPQKKIREKRKTSDPNLSKTNDVNLDSQGLSYNTNSGSSSNSSLSARSLDSPSAALDMVTATQQRAQEAITMTLTPSNIPPLLEDSDNEAEPDPPDWTRRVDENVLKSMRPREKKRQEVINELFHTEKSHVRKLKVLNQVFLKPMLKNQILPSDQLHLLFQNLEEMLDIHSRFNNAMKAKKKENPLVGDISDILLAMFDGSAGDNFQRAASIFCANQQIALEQLKERRRKDAKLNNFLTEAEGNPLCRRLQLKDMLPTVMQRLTKYPLLFENLAKCSPKGSEEEISVQQAVERSKDILNYVNQAVRAVEDHQRLAEIQKRLDKSAFEKVDHPMTNEFKNLDLRTHKLIYEGSLNWRIGNRQKLIDIHVLLLHDVIILLQKQDEKYVLKFYNVNTSSGGAPALSPIVKVSSVLVRDNAVDKTALYLVNTSHNLAQIYDLVASSPNERKIWFRHISEAADAYKHKDSFGRNRRVDPTASLPQSPPDTDVGDESPDKTKESEDSSENIEAKDGNELGTSGVSRRGGDFNQSNENSQQPSSLPSSHPSPSSAASQEPDHGTKSVDSSPSQRRKVEPVRLSTVQNSLIQPSEVVVSLKPVLTAEPVLTPLEQIRVKDEEIRKALLAKQQLVADVLHVPKEEFQTIAEMAGEPSVDKEAAELVLAAVNQANQLAAAVNEALRITEEEAVTFTSEVLPGYSPRGGRRKTRLPGVPAQKLQGISTSLNFQLTQLLKIVKERDEERELLRKELQKSREQIHVLHEAHRKARKSPTHSSASEEVVQKESGDVALNEVTESNREVEDLENSPQEIQEIQETIPDACSEVFVDALSGDMEVLEAQTETLEAEEDPPV